MTFFCCRKNTWSEDTIYEKFPDVINTLKSPNSTNGITFLSNNEPNPLAKLALELGIYSTRNLMKQSDTIHAFTGFLNRLAAQSKSGLLQGILTVSFDIGLLFCDVTAHPVPRAKTLPQYARREGFPTWSWAGWTSSKNPYAEQCKNPAIVNRWLQNNTYIIWYVRHPDSPQLQLVWNLALQTQHGKLDRRHIGYCPTYGNPYGHIPSPAAKNLQLLPDESDQQKMAVINRELKKQHYPFLHFFAYVVYAPTLQPPEPDLPLESKPQVHKVIGTDGRKCGSISVDNRTLLDGFNEPYEIVLLSKVDDYGRFFYGTNDPIKKEMYWAMLIKWVGRERMIAERRGLGFVYFDTLSCMINGTKYWKEIVLA